MRPCQGRSRGFESRFPLQFSHSTRCARSASCHSAHAVVGPSRSADEPPFSATIRSVRRRRQVVRQRSAKPPPPVQIRAAPPNLTSSFFATSRISQVVPRLATWEQLGTTATRVAPAPFVSIDRDDQSMDGPRVVRAGSRWRSVCHLPRLFTRQAEPTPGCRHPSARRGDEWERPMVFHVDVSR